MRISSTDVLHASRALFMTLKRLEFVPSGAVLHLHEGSATNGISWGLTYALPGERATRLHGVDLHGAMKARDAHQRITAANVALCAVEEHQREQRLARLSAHNGSESPGV